MPATSQQMLQMLVSFTRVPAQPPLQTTTIPSIYPWPITIYVRAIARDALAIAILRLSKLGRFYRRAIEGKYSLDLLTGEVYDFRTTLPFGSIDLYDVKYVHKLTFSVVKVQ